MGTSRGLVALGAGIGAGGAIWVWLTAGSAEVMVRRGRPPVTLARAPLPRDLRMSLDALNEPRAQAGDERRNPFRFLVRPVSLPPAIPVRPAAPATVEAPPLAPAPHEPLIPWKLTAVVQRGETRWAVFSDCRGIPMTVQEGDSLAGQWRVTRVGLESVSIRSLDNRPATLPLGGCAPR